MALRDYQLAAVPLLRQAVAEYGSVVYRLPTGGGKTLVAAEIARLAHANGKRTLLLVHRRELVKQAIRTLSEACPGVSVGVEAAGWPSQPWAMLQVGMVQSIAHRKYNIRPDLIEVDEAHHVRAKTWETVLARWPGVPRIGFTATPQRLDGLGLGTHFATMVSGPEIPELVRDGYLARTRTLRIPSNLSLEGVRTDKHGEYRESDLRDRVTDKVIASAVDAYCDYAMGRRAIFFGLHTEHSAKVCAGLRARGVHAEHVEAKDSTARRDRIMQEFRTGGIDVVGNVDIISEGFDAPSCDVVILGRPTKSVTRFLQAAGRDMRFQPGKVALLLDLVGCTYELGLPDEVREWSLEDGEIRVKQKPQNKQCPNCFTVFYGNVCPNCLAVAREPMPLPEVAEVRAALVEGKPRQKRKAVRLRKPELMRLLKMARLSENPKAALAEIASQNDYKTGWTRAILEAWGMK